MSTQKIWYLYIILTQDEQLYTGITTDPKRRWREHSSGKKGARYFRAHSPAKILWLETHDNRSSASIREAAIKKMSREQKWAMINTQATSNELASYLSLHDVYAHD